jgi:hypothetical protein
MRKAAQSLVKKYEGVEAASPKAVVRACFNGGSLEEEQARAVWK